MQARLQRLEANVRELQRFRQTYALETINRDLHLQWALRYGLLQAIQIVIDISCHVVSRKNLGTPATYAECIELLHRAGYLDGNLADVLSGVIGLRNILILVHEYTSIQIERLYGLLDRLDDFRDFAMQIGRHLQ